MTTLIICALFVYGVSTVINKTTEFFGIDLDLIYGGEHPLKKTEFDRFPKTKPLWLRFIYRPLFYCNVCMSSLWGSVYYVSAFGFEEPFSWILHLVVSAALIRIINAYV